MFTGIIESTGKIEKANVTEANARLIINAPRIGLQNVQIGDSISVNGVCLTVVEKTPETFSVDVSNETLKLTTSLNEGVEVNLEKALRFGDRFGGHMVSGHVDGVGIVNTLEDLGASWHLEIEAPGELAKYLARKGSVTINGVSLTVNTVRDLENSNAVFEINIIPHTHQITTLRFLHKGAKVNLEIDLVARYIERMLPKASA